MGVPFAVRVVCNVAAGHLVRWLASRTPEEIEQWKRQAVEWWKANRDLSELIPLDFRIPNGVKRMVLGKGFVGRVTRRVLDSFTARDNGACPAYDLILQYAHDMAANARNNLNAGDGVKEVMRQVQIIAAWLGNPRVKPWYYWNMDRAFEKVADQLVGDYGEPDRGAGEEGEEANSPAQAGSAQAG